MANRTSKDPAPSKCNSERKCGGNKPAASEQTDSKKATRIAETLCGGEAPVPDKAVFSRRTDTESLEKHGQKKAAKISERARYA
jgi:hypothetical protein